MEEVSCNQFRRCRQKVEIVQLQIRMFYRAVDDMGYRFSIVAVVVPADVAPGAAGSYVGVVCGERTFDECRLSGIGFSLYLTKY